MGAVDEIDKALGAGIRALRLGDQQTAIDAAFRLDLDEVGLVLVVQGPMHPGDPGIGLLMGEGPEAGAAALFEGDDVAPELLHIGQLALAPGHVFPEPGARGVVAAESLGHHHLEGSVDQILHPGDPRRVALLHRDDAAAQVVGVGALPVEEGVALQVGGHGLLGPGEDEIRILDGPVTPAMFGAGGDLDRDPGLLLEGRGRPFQGGVRATGTVEADHAITGLMDWVGLGIGGEGGGLQRLDEGRAEQGEPEGLGFHRLSLIEVQARDEGGRRLDAVEEKLIYQ